MSHYGYSEENMFYNLTFKKASIVVAFILFNLINILSCSSNNIQTHHEWKENPTVYHHYVIDSVNEYYNSLYSKIEALPNMPLPLSNHCLTYLNDKYKYELSNLTEYGEITVNEIKTSIFNSIAVDNYLICYITIDIDFQYIGVPSTSHLTESIQVALDCLYSPKIVDWYNPDPASYESQLRGDGLDLSDIKNLLDDSY
ncbi:MAG: hypothetical protein IJN80_08215 [Clostridia bacterium]|nr:hypothetical protein [Clostridia bacterium]